VEKLRVSAVTVFVETPVTTPQTITNCGHNNRHFQGRFANYNARHSVRTRGIYLKSTKAKTPLLEL
jgi:hypothetical protein